MSSDPFLTTEEVLDYLQINVRTIYRMVKRGEIPAVRVGRQWRFRKRDIDAWLAAQRRQQPAQARVLVVDDEPAVRDLISKALAVGHYEVETAEDGATAVARLRSRPYSLLITDLKMPGMDGLSVIRAAREWSPSLPIIIVTGHSTEASAIEAVNLGVIGYLTKPFSLERVLSAAARALGEG